MQGFPRPPEKGNILCWIRKIKALQTVAFFYQCLSPKLSWPGELWRVADINGLDGFRRRCRLLCKWPIQNTHRSLFNKAAQPCCLCVRKRLEVFQAMDVEASCITVATFLDFCYCGVDIENIGLPLLFFGPVYFFVCCCTASSQRTHPKGMTSRQSLSAVTSRKDATHVEKADIKSCCHQSVLLCPCSPKHAHRLQSHRAFQLIFCKVYKSKSVLKGMGFGKASGCCFVGQNIRTNHL